LENVPDFSPDTFFDFSEVLLRKGVTEIPPSPLFGTDGDIAYACNTLQTIVKCCNFKGLQHFFFGLLPVISVKFLPLRQ